MFTFDPDIMTLILQVPIRVRVNCLYMVVSERYSPLTTLVNTVIIYSAGGGYKYLLASLGKNTCQSNKIYNNILYQ